MAQLLSLSPAWALSLALGLSTLLLGAPAQAHCPNECELNVDDASFDPEISCLALRAADPQECDCAVNIEIDNNCDSGLVADGFLFGRCGEDDRDCDTVAAGDLGTIRLDLTEEGKEANEFSMSVGPDTTTLTVTTEVRGFEESGCSLSPQGRRPSPVGYLILAALLLLAWGRRTVNRRTER